MSPTGTAGVGSLVFPSSKASKFGPNLEVFPLLADPKTYKPNTLDLSEPDDRQYWFKVMSETLPDVVEKAVASEGNSDDSKRRGEEFARAFSGYLARLMEDPAAYEKLGIADLLELREDCLRKFDFADAYRSIKQRENEESLAVLPELLKEIDSLDEETRLLTLVGGVLAANIFDWGASASVELYQQQSIIDMYRMSRRMVQRPWKIDNFDAFKVRMLGSGQEEHYRHKKALIFVDNSGADAVLGILPLARELIKRGTEVVLVGNSFPALNDATAEELQQIVSKAALHCDIIKRAAKAGGYDGSGGCSPVRLMVIENGCGGPCINLKQVSPMLVAAARDADLVILEGMGRALHTNLNAKFRCDVLKLAMVKSQKLAEKLINGKLYDCVCKFELCD